jgi:hypothetical protein
MDSRIRIGILEREEYIQTNVTALWTVSSPSRHGKYGMVRHEIPYTPHLPYPEPSIIGEDHFSVATLNGKE